MNGAIIRLVFWGVVMGIDVKKNRREKTKQVSLNEAHDKLVVTEPDKNPVEHDIGLDELITAVFQRKKAKDRTGDGNPLIYALKNMHGFSISDADKNVLYAYMKSIINHHYSGEEFDTIVPLPSSKPIALWLAEACHEVLNVPIERNAFIKATNANILNQLQGVQGGQEIVELRKQLEHAKPNGTFAMKELSQHQREFVEPVKANPYYKAKERILLVDDLVSSGTSLKSAYNSIKNKSSQTSIECLTLLGPVT